MSTTVKRNIAGEWRVSGGAAEKRMVAGVWRAVSYVNYGETADRRRAAGEGGAAEKRMMAGDRQEDGGYVNYGEMIDRWRAAGISLQEGLV